MQEIMDALMQETISKQAEVMDTDSEMSSMATEVVVPKTEIKQEEKEAADKSDTEKSVKEKEDDGRQSIRVST